MDRLEKLQQFLKESPRDHFVLFAIAKEYEKRGADKEALHYYLRLRTENEAYVGLYYHLGKLWERLSEPVKAFEVYTEGMKIAERVGDQHALSELTGARMILGDEEDFASDEG